TVLEEPGVGSRVRVTLCASWASAAVEAASASSETSSGFFNPSDDTGVLSSFLGGGVGDSQAGSLSRNGSAGFGFSTVMGVIGAVAGASGGGGGAALGPKATSTASIALVIEATELGAASASRLLRSRLSTDASSGGAGCGAEDSRSR